MSSDDPEAKSSTPQPLVLREQHSIDEGPQITLLATNFYTTPTAAAGAAAAAAAAAMTSTTGSALASSSRVASMKSSSRSLKAVGSASMLKSDESACNLLGVQRIEGAVVAIEDYTGGRYTPVVPQKDTFWPCTFNLSKVIMGAGMMAIPKAFNLLGLLPGIGLMILMACLTFFTLASLIRATETTRAGNSYGALVRKTVGSSADGALQLAVLANCYVMNIVFVVVVGDILLGTAPDFHGLVPELFRYIVGLPPPTGDWFMGRPFVLGVLSLVVLLPLSSMRSMEKLAVVNIIGVASNGLFAGLMLALAAGAAANGEIKAPRLVPDWSDLGSTPLLIAVSLASIVPVLLNCDVCHQSLHPLMPLLKPYSVGRMQRLVAVALGICNVLYFSVTICAGLVFGEGLDADVLTNVNVTAMGPLIGPTAALIMSWTVRVGYLLSIIGSYVLLSYPLRQCIGDLILPGGQRAVQDNWQLLTTLLVGSVYCIACYLPSIWGALALIGATASTVQAFIVPGLVVLSVEKEAGKRAAAAAAAHRRYGGQQQQWQQQQQQRRQQQQQQRQDDLGAPLLVPAAAGEAAAAAAAAGGSALGRMLKQIIAVFVILLGVGLFANSIVDVLWEYFHPRQDSSAGSTANLMDVYRHLLQPAL